MIELTDITKVYVDHGRDVHALRGINLTIQRGAFTALAGPSGSGKTTLLNIIGGLDQPTEGDVIVDGVRINTLKPGPLSDLRLHQIGFVFQAYNLIPVLSAFENVEYVLLLQSVTKAEREQRCRQVLEDVGLEAQMHRRPHEMSGGQQQRVAIARAIVSRPAVVLADEPTANLDQKTGAHLMDLMQALNHTQGITFLFSTHDPMVMERSKRLIQLVDGRIASRG